MQRNCLYFICPLTGNKVWKENIHLLQRYAEQFNGQITFMVMQGPGLDPLAEVQTLCAGIPVTTWLIGANCTRLREAAHLGPMLETVQNQPGITWYGHTKGLTRVPSLNTEAAVALWTMASYETTLACPSLVDAAMVHHATVGSFRRKGAFWRQYGSTSQWHFSGTFYWLKNSALFAQNWQKIEPHTYGVESYPSTQFRLKDSECLFADDCGNPYRSSYWKHHLLPQLSQWRKTYLD